MAFSPFGAVVRDSTGLGVAVISRAVPTADLKGLNRTQIASVVVQAAQNESRKLGAPNVPYDLSPIAQRPPSRAGAKRVTVRSSRART